MLAEMSILAHSLRAHAEAVYFDAPLKECLRRNATRSRAVPPRRDHGDGR